MFYMTFELHLCCEVVSASIRWISAKPLAPVTSKGFLDQVDARVGLIPTARVELPYHGEVLRRMTDRYMDIYASDLAVPLGIDLHEDDGHHVRMLTDGTSYEIIAIPSDSFRDTSKPSLENAGAIEP